MRRDICHRTLAKLNSTHIAGYRDERLQSVAPATVIRELNTISHCLEVAQQEWGFFLPRNPAKLVRRPSTPQGRKRRFAKAKRLPFSKRVIVGAIAGFVPSSLGDRDCNATWRACRATLGDVDLHNACRPSAAYQEWRFRDVPLSQRATATLKRCGASEASTSACCPSRGMQRDLRGSISVFALGAPT